MFYIKRKKKSEPPKFVPLISKDFQKSSVTIRKYSGYDEFGNLHRISDTIIRIPKKKKNIK